ncbi:hypothetical protein J6590_086296, partial [Homalodisca vitripennis]
MEHDASVQKFRGIMVTYTVVGANKNGGELQHSRRVRAESRLSRQSEGTQPLEDEGSPFE